MWCELWREVYARRTYWRCENVQRDFFRKGTTTYTALRRRKTTRRYQTLVRPSPFFASWLATWLMMGKSEKTKGYNAIRPR